MINCTCETCQSASSASPGWFAPGEADPRSACVFHEICDVVLSGRAGWVRHSLRASLWQPEKALVECIRVIAEAK